MSWAGRSTADRSQQVEVADGVQLHVLSWDGGGGTPFVLVHGLASNARLWDGVAAELARCGHPVVATDLRGHGRSSKPDDGYDMATVADDVRCLLDRCGLDRPVVVGQSWGGNVVVELAARHPGAASAVAGIDGGAIDLAERFVGWDACAASLRPPPLAGMPADDFERLVRDAHPDWPETGIQGTLANVERRSDGTIAPWLTLDRHLRVLRGLWEHDPGTRLAQVREPVLLLGAVEPDADDDRRQERRRHLERAAAGAPHVAVETMTGDHDLHAQHPLAVAALLRTLAP